MRTYTYAIHVGAGIGKIAYANWYGYKTDKDIVKEERLER
jgi:hypothetical protein